MAYENWTTWTETDPSNDFTVAANQITIDTLSVGVDAMVHKDYGADHFDDFTHYIDGSFTDSANYSSFCIINYSNHADGNFYDYDDGIWLYFMEVSGVPRIYLADFDNDKTTNWQGGSFGTRYYFKIVRAGTTVTCYIYTDATHETLATTLQITDAQDTAFRYLNCAGFGMTGDSYEASGYLYNLDIGAVAGGVDTAKKRMSATHLLMPGFPMAILPD